MPPIRVLWGFLLAPIIPIMLISAYGMVHGLAPGGFVLAFFWYLIFCYLITFVVALPLYLLGWRFFRVTLTASVISGALIGAAIAFALRGEAWEMALFGATIACTFWWLAVRGSSEAQRWQP